MDIKIEINGKLMTLEEARELYEKLNTLFGEPEITPNYPYVVPPVTYPRQPWYEPVITYL